MVESIRADLDPPADHYIQIGGKTPLRYQSCEDVLAAAASTEPATVVVPDEPRRLMYTSGTTGNPKGAIRSHADMAMLALTTEIEFRLHRSDRALSVMPMCHANSPNFFTAFLYCGAAVTIFSRPSFDPELCPATPRYGG